MHETRLLSIIAVTCSLTTVFVVMLVLSSLYGTITDTHTAVVDGVTIFRVSGKIPYKQGTNHLLPPTSSWTDMLTREHENDIMSILLT